MEQQNNGQDPTEGTPTSIAKVILFTPGDEVENAITTEVRYPWNDYHARQGLKITITAGDDNGAGSVCLPFHLLSMMVAHVMNEYHERQHSKHQLIVPPGIVRPN